MSTKAGQAQTASPPIKNRSWSLSAELETKGPKTNGVIMACSGIAAGISLYLQKGVPVLHYNVFEEHRYVIKAKKALPMGKATLRLDFDYEGGGPGKGGLVKLYVDGQQVAEGKVERTVAGRFGVDTFGIGEDSAQPVTPDYKAPFRFEGVIGKVDIELK